MRITIVAAILAVLFAGCTLPGGPDEEAGWKLLIDGKTAKGWRGFRKKAFPKNWKVVDGALTRVGRGGDIITEDQYDDFELELEWKIEKGGNSGIMFFVTEDEPLSYMTGPEMQVLGKGGKSRNSSGACYGLYEPAENVTRPAGEWNTVRIVAKDRKIEHWMNGRKLCAYEIGSDDWTRRVAASKFGKWKKFGKAKKGHICLQDHGDEVAYRNIRIRTPK